MSESEKFLRNAMDTYGNSVYRLALCRLQNVADAEDIFQDVFLCLIKEKDAMQWGLDHMKAWLLRVTINKCNNLARSMIKRRVLPLTEIPELASEITQSDNKLWEAIGYLPVKFRNVILLYYVEGYKTEEISGILKCPAATVRSRLHRGRNQLKKMIGGILNEERLQRYDGENQSSECIER